MADPIRARRIELVSATSMQASSMSRAGNRSGPGWACAQRARCRSRRAREASGECRARWRTDSRGAIERRRRPGLRARAADPCRHACPRVPRPATSRQCGSSKQLAHSRGALRGSGRWPGHGDRHRAATHFDADVLWPLCGGHGQRNERGLGSAGGKTDFSLRLPSAGFSSVCLTHRRSRWALTPWAIATVAIETPGCMHAATAPALKSTLWLRRRRRVRFCSSAAPSAGVRWASS